MVDQVLAYLTIPICLLSFSNEIYIIHIQDYEQELIDWFWEVLTEMEEEDKRLYLKFVNGRAKLPSNPADM